MSIFIDNSYVGYVANRLDKFKQISSTVWNFKCAFCSGSSTNPKKRTGYFYTKDGKVLYYCHVCGASYGMGKFLKEFDEHLYNQYQKEIYIENGSFRKPVRLSTGKRKVFLDLTEKTPVNGVIIDYKAILSGSPFIHLSELPEDHTTKKYLEFRKIPKENWDRIAYIPKMSLVADFYPEYENLKESQEERLVIPVISRDLKLIGAVCRALNTNPMRYIELKFATDIELVVGMERLNLEETKYVTEGWADSFMLGNSIAIGGLALHKIAKIGLDKSSTILIPDSQPKHRNVVNAISKMVDGGYRVCLLPPSYQGKDFNQMVIDGELQKSDICSIIDANNYQGLRAKLEFSKWRKI